jgi:hypothetical protein
MSLTERMRVEAAEEALRARRQQESAAARRAERRQELVGRLREALERLDDQLLQLLDRDSNRDLLLEALQPLLAARGERRSILASAERARQLKPVVEGEIAGFEAELAELRRAEPDDGNARARREAAYAEISVRRRVLEELEADLARARALPKRSR